TRKRAARERAAARRERLLTEAVNLVVNTLGSSSLTRLVQLLNAIDPHKFRARVLEAAERLPPEPEPKPAPEFDEGKIAELRAKFQSQPSSNSWGLRHQENWGIGYQYWGKVTDILKRLAGGKFRRSRRPVGHSKKD